MAMSYLLSNDIRWRTIADRTKDVVLPRRLRSREIFQGLVWNIDLIKVQLIFDYFFLVQNRSVFRTSSHSSQGSNQNRRGVKNSSTFIGGHLFEAFHKASHHHHSLSQKRSIHHCTTVFHAELKCSGPIICVRIEMDWKYEYPWLVILHIILIENCYLNAYEWRSNRKAIYIQPV